MRVYENGVYRDATPEEVAEAEAREAQEAAEQHETLEERIAALEAELLAAKILLGADEQ